MSNGNLVVRALGVGRLLLCGALLWGACGGSSEQMATTTPASEPGTIIRAIQDPKSNIEGYKTYAWAEGLGAIHDPDNKWTPVGFNIDSELRFLIDRELRERGMSFANTTPDAIVTYLLVLDLDAQAEDIESVYGSNADMENLEEGALLIGIVDPVSLEVVWAGAARRQVSRGAPDQEVKARLSRIVDAIFEYYGRDSPEQD